MLSTRYLLLCALAGTLVAADVGPERGTLLIVGGGAMGPEIVNRFIDLAGGMDAPIVVIPTASEENEFAASYLDTSFLRKAGATQLTLLHTRDRAVADSEAFVDPLKKARGVFFPGGRQWRLADAYLNTRTERELRAVLDRGGVIGGSSAGATILGSYLVRGAVEGPHIMMAKSHETGFGFLRNAAIDQHLLVRKRENDMLAVIAAHPELLGIGIDESTAIVVQRDEFEVIGRSKVAIYDSRHDAKSYYFLASGDRFDLKNRKPLR